MSDSFKASTTDLVSNADRVYLALRELLVGFRIRPDERINESALARQLQTSRTPLREALNRLAAEGFLRFSEGRGFHCASFHPQSVLDLYELRQALETEAVRLACERASVEDLKALREQLKRKNSDYKPGVPTDRLLASDELFHTRITALSGNEELSRQLALINDRIRFFRLVDLDCRTDLNTGAHLAIVDAMLVKEKDKAVRLMRKHIMRGRKEATAAVGMAWSRLVTSGEREA